MATHSSNLAWEIPQTEEPSRLQSPGSQEWDTTWRLNHHQSELWLFLFSDRVPDLGRKWLGNQGPHFRTPPESASQTATHVLKPQSWNLLSLEMTPKDKLFFPASVSSFGTERVNLPWRLLWDKGKGQRGLTPICGG